MGGETRQVDLVNDDSGYSTVLSDSEKELLRKAKIGDTLLLAGRKMLCQDIVGHCTMNVISIDPPKSVHEFLFWRYHLKEIVE